MLLTGYVVFYEPMWSVVKWVWWTLKSIMAAWCYDYILVIIEHYYFECI